MARALIAPVAVVALVYLSICAMMWLAQDSMIFLRQPPDAQAQEQARRSGADELRIRVAEDVILHGWLRPAAGREPAPLLLYFGGNAEEVTWMQAEFARFPDLAVATFNYRGYGLSQGEPGEAPLAADAAALYDQLARRDGIDARRVILVGRSLGTGVAVHLAAQRPASAVVLISPYDSLTAVGARAYPWLPVRWLMRHPFDSLSRAPAIRTPLLALVAQADSVVPPEHSQRLAQAWGGPRTVIPLPGADHYDLLSHPAFWPGMQRFLGSVLGRAS